MTNWLVSGVSSGLGREIATAALERGDWVAGTVRSPADAAAFEALAPGRPHAILWDLADSERAAAVARDAREAFGEIDVLVNNAGYGLVGAVEEASLEEIRALFTVNAFSPFALIRAVLPAMRARRAGRIVNITSVSGLAVWAGTGAYCASKHAFEALGETLADELAPLGVAVINLAPGAMRTAYAGPSLVRSKARIADYDAGPAHLAEAVLTNHAGSESGDPAAIARAVLDLVDMAEPPRRVLIGADALHYVQAHAEALAADVERWRKLSQTVGFRE